MQNYNGVLCQTNFFYYDNFMSKHSAFISSIRSVNLGKNLSLKQMKLKIENALNGKRTFKRAQAFRNYDKYFYQRMEVKNLMRGAKCEEEIIVILLCKKKFEVFFIYVNNQKPISRKFDFLEDMYWHLHISNEYNVVVLYNFFPLIFTIGYDENLLHSKDGCNLFFQETIYCTSENVLKQKNDRRTSPQIQQVSSLVL